MIPILSQMHPLHTLPPYFPTIHSNVVFPLSVFATNKKKASEPIQLAISLYAVKISEFIFFEIYESILDI
jgi:hypothetical protein